MQASVDAANALLLAVLINVSLLKASPQGDGDLAEGLCSRQDNIHLQPTRFATKSSKQYKLSRLLETQTEVSSYSLFLKGSVEWFCNRFSQ